MMLNCSDSVSVSSNCTHLSMININNTDERQTPKFDASLKNILLAIVLGIIVIATIVENLLVILSFIIEKQLLHPFNLLILNLAVTDILVAITAMTFYSIALTLGYWPFGRYMCAVWIFFDFAMTFASVFTMVAISVDRLWCVTWPIYSKIHNNKRKAGVIIIIIWLCVIAIWTPPFIADRLKNSSSRICIWKPSDNTYFVHFVAVVGHYFPCIIILLCYIKLFMVMRSQRQAVVRLVADVTDSQVKTPPSTSGAHNGENVLGLNGDKEINKATLECSSKRLALSESTWCSADNSINAMGGIEYEKDSIQETTFTNEFRCKPRLSSHQLQREKRIFVTLTYIVFSFLLCWFPFYIVFHLSALKPDLVPDWLYSFFFWMTYVNSTLNPFIYTYTSREFRQAFVKIKRLVCVPCNSKLKESPSRKNIRY